MAGVGRDGKIVSMCPTAFHQNAAAGLYTCTQQRQESMLHGPSTREKRGGTQYASESALLHLTRL
jgi:hypothetical protein